MKKIISISALLSFVYLYLIYTIAPEWSKLFGFSDGMYLLKKEFVYLLIGFGIFAICSRMKSAVWFDIVGRITFGASVVMLLSMFFLPTSLVPLISAKRLYISIFGVYLYPMLFYIFGIVWLTNYLNTHLSTKNLNLSILGLMIFSAFIGLSFHDYGAFILLETLLAFLLFYINGINKYFIGSVVGVLLTITLFILISPHRLSRLENWMHSLDVATTNNPLEICSLSSLNNHFGIFSLMSVTALFLILIYFMIRKVSTDEKHKLFIVGIIATLTISLGLNILGFFGLLPVSPPPLYFFEYGLSIAIVSYFMIAMLGV